MKKNLVKRLRKKAAKSKDKSINRKNKKLMMDKIISYSPELLDGIQKYKDANCDFMLLMFLSITLINFPFISMLCCIASVVFLVKMLQFIKYRNINSIVNILGKDLAYKGIYDKGKIQGLVEEFKDRYGEDAIEYKKLIYMVEKYEVFITKIEYAINNMKITQVVDTKEKCVDDITEEEICFDEKLNLKKKVKDYYKDINDKFLLVYKNEDGEIRKINRAIEFFDDENNNGADTVVLKSNRRGNKNKLTVYLYKKSSNLQNNAL